MLITMITWCYIIRPMTISIAFDLLLDQNLLKITANKGKIMIRIQIIKYLHFMYTYHFVTWDCDSHIDQ